jgi:two-component system, chemotaxis family, protein-glutamate methylesterase/glutaminase
MAAGTRSIRVVIVDDSSLARAVLRKILEADGDIEVVGEAANGFEAIPRIEALKPDLVTMDIDMPGPNGLETVDRIMHRCPVPILIVTGERLGPGSDLGFRAIQLGALDFVAKPPITDAGATAGLRQQVRSLSTVPVFLHTAERTEPLVEPIEPDSAPGPRARYGVIAIASGTGGPRSLTTIVRALPENLSCPIAIVQQMPARFAESFAKYLASETSLRVRLVAGMPHECAPGELLLCNVDAHLFFSRRGVAVAMDAPPYAAQRPSSTVLLRSIAETYGREAIAILLSGMGDDGIEGLEAVRLAGGLTIAESPDAALVADLPKAALKCGAAMRALPAELIADFLVATVSNAGTKTTAPPSNPDILTP